MGHLVAAGDVAGALAEYERLAERLRRELAVAPSGATRELVERIRSAHGTPDGGRDVGGSEVTGGPGGARPPFPPLLAPARFAGGFVGRAGALEQLRGLWSEVRDGARRAAVVAGRPASARRA
jgi:hypothetical protein